MPLPKNGTPWPQHTPLTQKVAEHAAWYSGDPDQLSGFYGARSAVATHPSQHRGGVVGAVARWWWGTPPSDGEQRTKLHVPLAADICGTSADLLFSEPLQLRSDNQRLAEALTDFQDNGLDAKFHEGAEVAAALSGCYLRTVWDSDTSPLPWTEVAHPDGALPVFRNGQLREVTLWSQLAPLNGSEVYRLLEHHRAGFIAYGLYEGTGTNLGRRVPLTEHPESMHLAELVNEDGEQPTSVDRLLVRYVPNMLPNRLHRHSPQGRSDLQGVEPLLDALDEAYSSWWRDIRLAKARIHVPRQYIESSDGPGSPGMVDTDREVYVALDGVLPSKENLMIEAQQFAIRVTEHAETCRQWTERIIESSGYSTQSLSSGTGGAVTAAEVHSHERRSYMTRGKKVRYWTPQIREHLQTMIEVANTHLSAGIPEDAFTVEFQDGVQESASSLAGTVQALRNAEAASTETRVRMLHPDWSAEDVASEVAAILSESGGAPVAVPDDAGL